MGFNRVLLIGQAVSLPHVSRTNNNLPMAEFPLVVERMYRSQTGEDRSVRTEVPVVAYGSVAERLERVTSLGEVHIEGRIRHDVTKDSEGRILSSRYCIVADRCEFEAGPPDGAPASRGRAGARAPAAVGRDLIATGAGA